ncbi:hypothetical protein L195_g035283 [Trifolium pratense]|uniref:Uncharacterized protein n=1 Tax=Trifolium pratense TaxID=57577 RepID=A0A2K3LLC1_TRIPR|nr:hypothetical protein L195_g035283 [Trifolium pratense]
MAQSGDADINSIVFRKRRYEVEKEVRGSSAVGNSSNKKYEFSINHGDGVDCEAPIETEWLHEVGPFWERLTGYTTNTFEGNLASMIYNPTIR